MARRYEFYFRVAKTIFYERAQRVSKILFLPRDLLTKAFLMIFRRFPTTFRRFPKIFQNCSEGQTNVPEHFSRISENFRRFPKISEDCRRLSRKTRRCFDGTPTNLSTIKETNLISMKSSINSRVRLWKINYSGPGCSFYEFYEWYIFQ